MAPLVCQAIVEGLFEPRAFAQLKCYESAMLWARTEGIICAPETSHAIAAIIDEANKAAKSGKEKVILFNYSGHGLMDLAGYDAYLSGKLTDYVLPDEEIQENLQAWRACPRPRPASRVAGRLGQVAGRDSVKGDGDPQPQDTSPAWLRHARRMGAA